MRKVSLLLSLIFLMPALSYADDDLLSQYQNMINQANKLPSTNGTQQNSTPVNPAISSGQAALIPAPLSAQSASVQQSPAPTQYSEAPVTENQNPSANQQTTPAAPPNIFLSPGSGTANKQGSSIIHY